VLFEQLAFDGGVFAVGLDVHAEVSQGVRAIAIPTSSMSARRMSSA
jgi:hypothetical protein